MVVERKRVQVIKMRPKCGLDGFLSTVIIGLSSKHDVVGQESSVVSRPHDAPSLEILTPTRLGEVALPPAPRVNSMKPSANTLCFGSATSTVSPETGSCIAGRASWAQ